MGAATHTAGLGAAGDQQCRRLPGRRGGAGLQVDTGTPLPLFSRVTVPLTRHTRQTLCFPVGRLQEVNRKPGQAGRPGHPRPYRSPSSWTLFSARDGERRRRQRLSQRAECQARRPHQSHRQSHHPPPRPRAPPGHVTLRGTVPTVQNSWLCFLCPQPGYKTPPTPSSENERQKWRLG